MRRTLFVAAALAGASVAAGATAPFPAVLPGAALEFPADEGAHPEYRTEWWYVTGWLTTEGGAPLGFQATFFRTRPGIAEDNPSGFAARQVVIAHAALSDPRRGHALHAERIARAGFGLAQAELGRTDVAIRDWRLAARDSGFDARLQGEEFGLELALARRGPPMANGRLGYSQKGPAPTSASRYYSIPQLDVAGRVSQLGRTERVRGVAWLDHEWSSAYLDAESVGWDWVGLNLGDGGALMAFRIRDAAGATRWAGGTRRTADGRVHTLALGDVEFLPQRRWRSPRTGIEWPVAMQLRAGDEHFELVPLLDDQESDSRLTTGAVYWEGAVTADAAGAARARGYLELTGYGEPLKLP